MKKFGIIVTTCGGNIGIRNLSEQDKDRFIHWMENDIDIPMLSFDSYWDNKISKKYVIKRLVCGFEVLEE